MTSTKIIFDLPIPPWVAGALALLVLAAVIVWTVRDLARLGLFTRIAIILLTALGTLLAIGLFLNPRVRREWPDPQKPLLLVLADNSGSVALRDKYAGAEAETILNAQIQTPGAEGGEVARADIERWLLSLKPGTLLGDLNRNYDIKLMEFADAAKVFPLADAAQAFHVDENSRDTAIGNVLEAVYSGADENAQKAPSAIIMLSDGATNTGRDPADPATALGLRSISVSCVGLGDPNPPVDVSVISLHAPQQSALGDVVHFEATVLATSPSPMRVTLQIREGRAVKAERTIVTLPGARPLRVELLYEPTSAGRHTYDAVIKPTEDHPDIGKNTAQATVEIVNQPIRVLLIDAEPRWEFRFIRSVLERDERVAPTICLLRPGVGPIKGPGYLSELPIDKKGFADFDVVILGDVPRNLLPDAFLKELADWVRIHGGALAVIAGRRGNYRSLSGTPVEDILPVLLTHTPGAGERDVKLELTQEGAASLLTRLSPDENANAEIWNDLPVMPWSADVAGLARGATMLLANANESSGPTRQPILAIQYPGAGKTLFSGVEDTWRWRKSIGDKYHYRFWAQAVAWMMHKRFSEGDRLCRLSLSRTECNVNEPVEIVGYCLDDDGFPISNADVSVQITPEKGDPQRLGLQAVPGGWGLYRATFIPQQEGQYKFNPIVGKHGPNPIETKVPILLQVMRPDLEKSYLGQDVNALKTIAEASGGKYVTIAGTNELKSLLVAKAEGRMLTEEFPPFRNRIFYAILAIILSAAWFLRKKSGLA